MMWELSCFLITMIVTADVDFIVLAVVCISIVVDVCNFSVVIVAIVVAIMLLFVLRSVLQ